MRTFVILARSSTFHAPFVSIRADYNATKDCPSFMRIMRADSLAHTQKMLENSAKLDEYITHTFRAIFTVFTSVCSVHLQLLQPLMKLVVSPREARLNKGPKRHG